MDLAPYAALEIHTRGRRHAEPGPNNRSAYMRDRDRIIHSAAFRRLEYKTQVFVNHEGDLFRTRLTHSLEVAQLARTMARSLRLNEDLCEAISLAHDLGHTPFGHAGQDALNEVTRPYGGFEHNAQSLRVVDELEDKYASFRGLNLSFETREGILKHCSLARARKLGDVGRRFIERGQPSLEAQLANLADEIAYNNHDIDDGLRAGLLTVPQLREVPLFRRHHDMVLQAYGPLPPKQERHETIRRIMSTFVEDLTSTSAGRIADSGVQHIDEVRAQQAPLMSYSEAMRAEIVELKRFLHAQLYRHHQVYRVMNKAQRVVRDLFAALFEDLRLMPPEFAIAAASIEAEDGAEGRARVVADYIAGMTDRYALDEHERLFDPRRLR
ncbi:MULTISPECIES: deoxyguanosinetriphosphate triphosphohydrolase [Hydrocarboniphaga]|jgi:dGTPase|uniref:Deoxyguanosinetriphosphate triphosphohydrolase-like protein n=1 Tax=Hydrocarboniphaga effusa AP103 TaxID=1172194 RepID=I8TCA8_9GAMM|nr:MULTISPECIES: deoxyguanosinetriphosphate triphosphohydrolase [Hydrocarboniphaga]EIT71545.1 dGTPase [Hydrocarboniphaga effusa AP103]MDZ4077508.1 deoxyguanosinetriphosphate triphosphohydrolase [Hydrocarboniphaga sp.]